MTATVADLAPAGCAATAACFHCGEAVLAGTHYRAEINGRGEPMCCPGCAAAASAIVGLGLDEYYRVRDALAPRPQGTAADAAALAVYDDAALLERYAHEDDGVYTIDLVVNGMRCAACAWLLEQRIMRHAGVVGFEVNLATARATLSWRAADSGLAAILGLFSTLGFSARPYSADARRAANESEARDLLRRLGVAMIFAVQVMMIALAFYVGGSGEDGATERFLQWVAMVLTLPVLLYSAQPFYHSAWRAARAGALNMDVPVSLALMLAFAGSAWHTVSGISTVYFDSVVMFVVFLLATRYLELRARVRAATRLETLAAVIPDAAQRFADGRVDGVLETVPSARLRVDDVLWVRAGEVIAADGVITTGRSSVNEAIVSGESRPCSRGPGAAVLAGSVNLESPLTIRVRAVGEAAFAGQLAALVARAAASRANGGSASDALARGFVAAVLLLAALTAAWWGVVDPERSLSATLAVLVAACPCALALARPAAVAAAHAALLTRGVAVLTRGALERLAAASRCVCDKTGTLTRGELALSAADVFHGHDAAHARQLAAALAEASRHPLATALRRDASSAKGARISALVAVPGCGARARVEGVAVQLGSRAFIAEQLGAGVFDTLRWSDGGGKEAFLARDGVVLARYEFSDRLREEAPALVAWLEQHGFAPQIMSGDRSAVVSAVAAACGLERWQAQMRPADKMAAVRALQDDGAAVIMIGDGLNDAPVMAQADVSIAVNNASAAVLEQADILLLAPTLDGVRLALEVGARLRRVVRQNLTWAVTYNLAAVPLAASGALPPWAAALGMCASSLLVVGNALSIRARPLRAGD